MSLLFRDPKPYKLGRELLSQLAEGVPRAVPGLDGAPGLIVECLDLRENATCLRVLRLQIYEKVTRIDRRRSWLRRPAQDQSRTRSSSRGPYAFCSRVPLAMKTIGAYGLVHFRACRGLQGAEKYEAPGGASSRLAAIWASSAAGVVPASARSRGNA